MYMYFIQSKTYDILNTVHVLINTICFIASHKHLYRYISLKYTQNVNEYSYSYYYINSYSGRVLLIWGVHSLLSPQEV